MRRRGGDDAICALMGKKRRTNLRERDSASAADMPRKGRHRSTAARGDILLSLADNNKGRDFSFASAGAAADVGLPPVRRRRSTAREEGVSVLADVIVYKPQTKETRASYDAMLSVIQQQFGGQPMDVLGGAAEPLTILKNLNPDKKRKIETLLNPLPTFQQSVSIGKLITDISGTSDPAAVPSGDGVDTAMDNDAGVGVEFEEDDDEKDFHFDQLQVELGLTELNRSGGMQMGVELDEDGAENSYEGKDSDAYFLERESLEIAKISNIIAEGDDRDVENHLVMELDYDIVWCTRLARDEEMVGNTGRVPVLKQLHATRASAKERQKNLEKSIRDEAKRLLNNASAGADFPWELRAVESGCLKDQRQLLDLGCLPFHQGGLLMANKKCELLDKIPDMTAWAQPAFAGMQQLNMVQSKVYVAPMKALIAILSARLQGSGLSVRELSGQQNLTKQQIDQTPAILTAPEKWDIVTRKSGDRTSTQMVKKLLITDEIYLLHDNRGPVLEMTTEHTLPNYGDVVVFLRVCSEGLFHFDNSYIACPLAQQYISITLSQPLQRFQLMDANCYEKVVAAVGLKHQVLIFVHYRKGTVTTARAMRDTTLANDTLTRFLKDDSESQKILGSQAEVVLETVQNAAPETAQIQTKPELQKRKNSQSNQKRGKRSQGRISEAKMLKPSIRLSVLRCRVRRFLVFLLFLLLVTVEVTADSTGARCDARSLSIQLATHCEVTQELQSKACCDSIFATLGRKDCLCKVAEEPEYRSSGMAGGGIIVDMYHGCDGGPYVSPTAEEECGYVESPPPQSSPPPPSPPSAAKEDWRLPRHKSWTKVLLIVGGIVLFMLTVCGLWKWYTRGDKRWSGQSYRLGGETHWWSRWGNKILEKTKNVKNTLSKLMPEGSGWLQHDTTNAAAPSVVIPPSTSNIVHAPPAPPLAASSAPNYMFAREEGCVPLELCLEMGALSIDATEEDIQEESKEEITLDEDDDYPGTPLIRKQQGRN